eukprot:6192120-Pleurochrysis_carterae.AAC.2
MPGVHYAPVDTVAEIPAAIRRHKPVQTSRPRRSPALRNLRAGKVQGLLPKWPVGRLPCRRLREDDAFARQLALAGQQRMAQMDVEEVTHYCYQMLKGYAAMQRFKPKRDPRSFEVNCEDDLIRRYSRMAVGGSGAVDLESRYLTENNATCLRPPAKGEQLGPPAWGGSYDGSKVPCLAAHDLSAPAEKGVCEEGGSGRIADGPDWDVAEAYAGGSLPNWHDPDPADTGRASRVMKWRNVQTISADVRQ